MAPDEGTHLVLLLCGGVSGRARDPPGRTHGCGRSSWLLVVVTGYVNGLLGRPACLHGTHTM